MRILYLDIDSLRPDHLGCYGYHRNTSPAIDAIAKESVRFENYYCTDAPCLPSRTAFYSGRFGIHTGVVGHGGTAADPRIQGADRKFRNTYEIHSLPAALQRAGFHTAQISPFGQRHSAHHFFAGFNEIHNTGEGGMESAEVVTPVVEKWLTDNASKDNWYLHINYWDPHTPYRTPEGYPEHFADDPLPEWLTDEVFAEHLNCVGPHSALEIGMYHDREDPKYPKHPGAIKDREGLRKMIDGYDNGVRYADDQVARIVEMLKAAGVYEETAIVISADHGENQGELGIYGEHGTADHITCRVPLIIKWPGLDGAGQSRQALHYNVDFAPTLMEMLQAKGCDGVWDGKSFASSITGSDDEGQEFLVISQCAHVCQRSVRFGPWLYMRTYHDGYHLFPEEMLFNLEEDPHEQHNLAEARRDICDQALRHLHDWHTEMMATSSSDIDPMWTVLREGGPYHAARGTLKKYIPHLENTGRAWAVEKLKERHPSEPV